VEGLLSFARGRGGIGLEDEPTPVSAEEQIAIETTHLG